MGSQGSKPAATSDVKNESHNSARNVLEGFAESIKNQAEKDAKEHGQHLTGELQKATFRGAHTQTEGPKTYGYSSPCGLNHTWNTNLLDDRVKDRDPCDGRNQKRFDENEGFECSKSRIKGNENNSDGGSCAPPRRRHMCDKNLEALNESNTQNVHDLLGNVLVTAKYEGDYIINNHPHKGTSEVCIALARSFADIGDIVRGIDIFKPNDKDEVQNGLKKVFKNIHDSLSSDVRKNYPDDGFGNYYKLREAWWNANRDKVWNALTCSIPYYANYVIKKSDDTIVFTDNRKCGHNEGAPPTNLDYVPQFLRWFDEWAEEFCRIRKDKLKKVKEVCRGKNDENYCDGNGYDCKQTDISRNILFVDLNCPRCEEECTSYNEWIEKKIEEFSKQKKKYDKEIGRSSTFSNNEYDTRFYESLGKRYPLVNSFLDPMKEGLNCSMDTVDGKIDFEKLDVTFSPSSFCKTCPLYGVKCNNSTRKCTVNSNDKNTREIINDKNATHIDVEMIYHRGKNIKEDQKKLFKKSCLFRTIRNENWRCNVYNNLDVCRLNNFQEKIDPDEKIRFNVLIDRWLKDFIKGYYISKQKIEPCIPKENEQLCIISCKEKCTCVENWIKKKENEWKTITQYSNKKKHADSLNIVHKVRRYFDQIKSYVNKYIDDYDVLKNQGEHEDCIDGDDCTSENKKNKNDFVIILLNRLKKKIETCKSQHEESNNQNCLKTLPNSSEDDEEDESDDEEEDQTPRNNPCVTVGDDKSGGSGKIKSVRHVAKEMQKEVHEGMLKRSGDKSGKGTENVSVLKGYIEKAIFGKAAKSSDLDKGKFCHLDQNTHTNAESRPGYRYEGPCTGKNDKRFKIGKEWEQGEKLGTKVHIYMPPRRQHMCTSNLENLDLSKEGLSNSSIASNSLLGDVLLAAKYEAENIKKLYQQNNSKNSLNDENDKATVCRAMKYSFADLGDIIRGKDLWEKNGDAKRLQEKLEKIFAKIKEKLHDESMKKIYEEDNDQYKQLREDWWEANRDQVWEAMQCGNDNPCSGTDSGIPFDDYVPQRLRWMTEWAEWYCKAQKEAYDKLNVCEKCRSKGKCKQGNGHCVTCKTACDKYKRFIQIWKPQWNKMEQKYSQLYEEAKNYSDNAKKDTKDKDDYVLKFLNELQKANGVVSSTPSTKSGNTATSDVYGTAARYVHQELPNMDCKDQYVFCEKKDGNNYAFEEMPKEYKEACGCKDRLAPVPKHVQPKEDPCKIVKGILNGKKEKSHIGNCKPKTYEGWNCNSQTDPNHTGACMPPRRQKLCIKKLTQGINGKEDLRTAFIKCAAAETFLSWNYYKSKNNSKGNLDNKLKEGEIPPEFLRSMFYTYGDYRDLCLGKDIGNDVGTANQKIDEYFKKYTNLDRTKWWTHNGKDIWESMLCSLSYDSNGKMFKNDVHTKLTNTHTYSTVTFSDNKTTLEKFAERYQFLRWFTEWSDEFCRERKKKEEKIEKDCTEDYEGCANTKGIGNANCVTACNEYKQYIEDKKKQYDKQNEKFEDEKSGKDSEYNIYSNSNASEYLKDKCFTGTCSCIEKVQTIKDYWEQPHTTYNDENLQKKCSCPQPPCEIVDKTLGDKTSKSYAEGCRHKYTTRYAGWDCGKGGESGKGNEDGDVCIPPRRKRLYIKDLEDLKGDETQVDLRKAFIKCAAVETFFAWHEYKMEKKLLAQQNARAAALVLLQDVKPKEDPQTKLDGGDIPEEFKRQMFYTFGDYRDIFFGRDMSKDVNKVKTNIDEVFTNSDSKIPSDKNHNDQHRQNWWTKYAPDIWQGMLCALSYNTETKIKNENVHKKLIEEINNNKYKYDKVVFSGGFNQNSTKLDDFVKRPQLFRWLEEWAHEFCTKRTHKLAQIKEDCRGPYGQNKCDDDGFECKEMCPNKDERFETFNCLSCAKSCKSYKKWISTKKDEFYKHEPKYKQEIQKLENDSDNIYDENFIKTFPKTHKSLESFLKNLKGACINNNIGNSTIDFNKPGKTFGHAEYCAPCSVIGIKCEGVNNIQVTERTCKDKKEIATKDIKDKDEPIGKLYMVVSDNGKNKFQDHLNDVCKETGIFKGIRKDEWTCGYVCGLDICELKPSDGKEGDKQNILIRALFKRWLENFLQDYNKISDKISQCMNIGKQPICINQCANICKCVSIWIQKKKEEWENIKKRYFKQYKIDTSDVYEVRRFLENGPFDSDIEKVKGAFKELRDLEESDECTDPVLTQNGKGTKKDVVQCILYKLQKKIDTCKKMHNITGQQCTGTLPNTEDDKNAHIPLGFLPPPFCNVPANPCGKPDATNVVNVEEVAEILHQEAKDKMVENSVVHGKGESGSGKSSLQGNIKNAKLKNGRTGTALNNVCSITKEYTNDKRGSTKDGACEGKDGNYTMFQVVTGWKNGNQIGTANDVFLPPRRQHFCTSNLENLNINNNGLKGANARDSLLVDVLLAAKYEANFIKERYNHNKTPGGFKNEAAICRAIKYSFADIGDIIKGTDLWDQNSGEITTQNNLVRIFKEIKEKLSDDIKGKYTDGSPYLDLRKDWWEANRDQVWEAMKCATTTKPPLNIKCGDTPPLVDYIPQRLRWMTEWAEWFCKMQSQAYEELEKKCRNCRSGICDKGKDDCAKCTKSCEEYNKKIQPWEKQWEKISQKYKTLYQQANDSVNGATTSSSTDEKDKDVVDFLKMLYQKNTHNTIYSTVAGYIHQEAHINDCQKQTLFCKNT
ncbi:hypothetical protein PFTANZ_05899, partial [Plasmodium falciparum Tanzania (2000708)]